MSGEDKTTGMKSAYDLALERLDEQGIDRPQEDTLSAEVRDQIAEIRQRTEASLAKLEILLRDRMRTLHDPIDRAEAQKEYSVDRQRLEEKRDRQIDKLRAGS